MCIVYTQVIMSNFTDFIQPLIEPLQVFFLVASIILILMQNRGAGLSNAFGGSNEIYLTRRGIEKWVVNFTVIAITGFIFFRFLDLYI